MWFRSFCLNLQCKLLPPSFVEAITQTASTCLWGHGPQQLLENQSLFNCISSGKSPREYLYKNCVCWRIQSDFPGGDQPINSSDKLKKVMTGKRCTLELAGKVMNMFKNAKKKKNSPSSRPFHKMFVIGALANQVFLNFRVQKKQPAQTGCTQW